MSRVLSKTCFEGKPCFICKKSIKFTQKQIRLGFDFLWSFYKNVTSNWIESDKDQSVCSRCSSEIRDKRCFLCKKVIRYIGKGKQTTLGCDSLWPHYKNVTSKWIESDKDQSVCSRCCSEIRDKCRTPPAYEFPIPKKARRSLLTEIQERGVVEILDRNSTGSFVEVLDRNSTEEASEDVETSFYEQPLWEDDDLDQSEDVESSFYEQPLSEDDDLEQSEDVERSHDAQPLSEDPDSFQLREIEENTMLSDCSEASETKTLQESINSNSEDLIASSGNSTNSVTPISQSSSFKQGSRRRLFKIDSITSTQRRCCICPAAGRYASQQSKVNANDSIDVSEFEGTENVVRTESIKGRCRIPKPALNQAWIEKNIFIPHNNRVCSSHLSGKYFTPEALDLLKSTRTGVLMSDDDLADWMLELSECARKYRRRKYDFSDPLNVSSSDYPHLVGVSKEHFESMLSMIKGKIHASENRTVDNALATFLMLLRHNWSQEVLKKIFGYNTQSSVSDTIRSVANALDETFVKHYLGTQHLTREEAINNHGRRIYNELFEESTNDKLFVILDGTYLYIERPQDFTMQKLTYSLQKKRNLLKPMMIVLPSGYILDVGGPFYADSKNNDAQILKKLIRPSEALSTYLKENDHAVVDRGFRDVVSDLKKMKIHCHMPKCKSTSEQFSTRDANESRKVTLVRWIVEAVNGRQKRKFKFFRAEIAGGYFEKIPMFFRIACAMANAFYPPLSDDSERSYEIGKRAVELVASQNKMKQKVVKNKWDKDVKSWDLVTSNNILDFPRLLPTDLETLTLGVYQINLAKRYCDLHCDSRSDFKILVKTEAPNVIRCRIESRFKSQKSHDLWIEYEPNAVGSSSISGYYCKCMQGARTVGMCAHTTAVIWFLSYSRYLAVSTHVARSRRRRSLGILNAGSNESSSEEDVDTQTLLHSQT